MFALTQLYLISFFFYFCVSRFFLFYFLLSFFALRFASLSFKAHVALTLDIYSPSFSSTSRSIALFLFLISPCIIFCYLLNSDLFYYSPFIFIIALSFSCSKAVLSSLTYSLTFASRLSKPTLSSLGIIVDLDKTPSPPPFFRTVKSSPKFSSRSPALDKACVRGRDGALLGEVGVRV